MQPFTLRRPASAAIAVLAISLAGVVVAPATAAHAAPTAWTCAVTGSVTNALPIIGSAATSLFLGAALIFIAGARRRQTRSFQ